MRLIFSKTALDDLVRLRVFIADHNPVVAQKVSKRMRGAIKQPCDAPRIGRPVESGMPGEMRELIFGCYVVRYEVRGNILYVLRIWHGKEDR